MGTEKSLRPFLIELGSLQANSRLMQLMGTGKSLRTLSSYLVEFMVLISKDQLYSPSTSPNRPLNTTVAR